MVLLRLRNSKGRGRGPTSLFIAVVELNWIAIEERIGKKCCHYENSKDFGRSEDSAEESHI